MDGLHAPTSVALGIVPRKAPPLDIAASPRFWFDNDPFKTRFFDALSLLFPEGEKFFIACVRDYRANITDPELQQQVKDFIYQEGQHGALHTAFNDRLKAQGVEVDKILSRQRKIMFDGFRGKLSKRYTLGQTAAAEHLTAIMAHRFTHTDVFADADPTARALFAWHAVEEIEHKAVAFDVLHKVAKGSWLNRVGSMLQVSLTFPMHVALLMNYLLKLDGVLPNKQVWKDGRQWLFSADGLLRPMLKEYLQYYRVGFHPNDQGDLERIQRWRDEYAAHGDAQRATDLSMQAS
jgi:uncharacterized protein